MSGTDVDKEAIQATEFSSIVIDAEDVAVSEAKPFGFADAKSAGDDDAADGAEDDEEGVVRRSMDEIMKGVAKGLNQFSVAYVFMLAVELIIAILLVLRIVLSGNKVKNYVIPVVFAICRALAWTLLGTMTTIFSRVASHHFVKAAECTERTNKISRHQEKAMLFLSSLFNTLGLSLALLALMDGAESVIIYNEVIAVIAVSALIVALSWALGMAYIRHWFLYKDSSATGRLQLEEMLKAPTKEKAKIPLIVLFWVRKIFGRSWQRAADEQLDPVSSGPSSFGRGQQPAKKSCCGRRKKIIVPDVGEYRRVRFVPGQIHILKMLPEAMWNASGSMMLSVYSSVLVLGTYLVADFRFSIIFQPFLEIVRYGLVLFLTVQGAYIFEAALFGGQSDMHRLARGFLSIEATFSRLTRSFAITSVIQLVTVIIATYTSIKTKTLEDI